MKLISRKSERSEFLNCWSEVRFLPGSPSLIYSILKLLLHSFYARFHFLTRFMWYLTGPALDEKIDVRKGYRILVESNHVPLISDFKGKNWGRNWQSVLLTLRSGGIRGSVD